MGRELANGRAEEEITPTKQDNGNTFREREMEIPRREERPKSKRREKASPCGAEMDLGGKPPREICRNRRLEIRKKRARRF